MSILPISKMLLSKNGFNTFASGRNSDSATRIIYYELVMSTLDNESHLGLVVGGSLDRGLDIKLDKSSNLEEIKVG
ncbi:hypothetical protein M1N17_01570, partial [Dehalococcoidia bacterium]|nr:hypothetical protein [Dehalococcoidia bacterium]